MVPFLTTRQQKSSVTDTFYGYRHTENGGDGSWYFTENLCADRSPGTCVRKKRGLVTTCDNLQGLISRDGLVAVRGGKVYYNDYETGLNLSAQGEKQLISMGAYLVIFPDKKYLNTADLTDYGSLDNTVSINTAQTALTLSLCRADGTAVQDPSLVKPEEPSSGDLWLDISGDIPVIYAYSGEELGWTEAGEIYLSLAASGIGSGFRTGDGIEITGLSLGQDARVWKLCLDRLQGYHPVVYASANQLVIEGTVPTTATQTSGTVSVSRPVPDMDYVCQCGNRLWGCRYGLAGSETVNEIYGSKLGDFRNWNCFAGLSTDSYVASVGSDGVWTGAICFRDRPVFFKENTMHTLTVSAVGAHSISELVCRGVESGSHRSLAIIDQVLYYKSPGGICAYDGSLPVVVSDALGSESYTNAVAGSMKSRYYVCMTDESSNRQLFTYDTDKGLWYRQDSLPVTVFCTHGQSLLAGDSTGKLWDMTGKTGTPEENVSWEAVSGKMHWAVEDRKYLTNLRLRMLLEGDAYVQVSLEYDSDGVYHEAGYLSRKQGGLLELPIVPRRCDHLRLKLKGAGQAQISAITWVVEEGGSGW